MDVPSISDVLGRKVLIKHPNKINVNLNDYKILQAENESEKLMQADPILSANKIPRKFPIKAESVVYSSIGGVTNPLYRTTSFDIGSKKPMQHELAERYFPLNNRFSKAFANMRVKSTALNTGASRSRIHSSFDSSY